MSKPVWTWTHTGEQGEELCCIDSMYFTKFAWDHFLAAYTGKVRRVGRDRPGFGPRVYPPNTSDHHKQDLHGGTPDWTGTNNWWHTPEVADFLAGDDGTIWPEDEPTDPMPQPVIRPGKLIASFPLKKKDKP